MADWSLLQQPNFAQAALSGYQAGQAIGKQRRLDGAFSGIDLERPETLLPVLRADPSTGAALIGASVKLASEKRDAESRQATANYVKALTAGQGGGTTSASPSSSTATSNGTAAGQVPSSTDANGEIVVNAPTQQPDMTTLRNAAIDADPNNFLDIQSKIGTMQKAQRDALGDAADAFGSVAQQALGMPYQQRKAFIATQAGYLSQHGVTPDQIAGFDPTDDALHAEVGKAVGIKGIIDQANKDRSFALDQAKFGEEQRHNQVDEGQGQQRIGLEGANVGIARAHLALDQQKAAASNGGGTGALPAPGSAAAYAALPRGTRYRAPDGSIRVKN